MGPAWASSLKIPPGLSGANLAVFKKLLADMVDEKQLLDSIEAAGITARVINSPTEFLQDADGNVANGTEQRINDGLAKLQAKYTGKIYALATVDAFSGDDGAREVTRAVRELGLRGIFLKCAKGDLILGDKQTHPTLAAAALLGVPMFVHPQNDPQLVKRFAATGTLGLAVAIGTINSAALCHMLETGTFEEIPNMRVVVSTWAFGGVLLAAGPGDGQRIRRDAPDVARRHVYIDTMAVNPALIRTSVDVLGADHVVVGTDWPVNQETSMPEKLQRAFAHCGLNAAEQEMIASGNLLKLMGIG
jgi:aminocarboxymuconate-semialdehyde decarboxylase